MIRALKGKGAVQVTQEKVQFLKDAAGFSKFTDVLDLEVFNPPLPPLAGTSASVFT